MDISTTDTIHIIATIIAITLLVLYLFLYYARRKTNPLEVMGMITGFFTLITFVMLNISVTFIQILGTYHGGHGFCMLNFVFFLLFLIGSIFIIEAFKRVNKRDFRIFTFFGMLLIAIPLIYFGYYILYYTHQALFDNFMISVWGSGGFDYEPVHIIIAPIIIGWIFLIHIIFIFKFLWHKYQLLKVHNIGYTK